jgi:2-desacetyl-2-hydroxyethyl bacteriochlorophyllide A dehydrogenase
MPKSLFELLRAVYLRFPEKMRPAMKAGFYGCLIRFKAIFLLRRVYRAKRVEFLYFDIAYLERTELLGPGKEEVLVETFFSVVSPGTEQAILWGLPGMRHNFPFTPGYSGAGTVLKVGSKVKGFQVGQRVAGMIHHVSHETLSPSLVFEIPSGVSSEEASFIVLGIIALQGTRKARIVPGDRVAVVGQGLIGQLCCKLARLFGASEIIAVGSSRSRENISLRAGVDVFLSLTDGKQALRDVRADAVIEAAGMPQAIAYACECAANKGRVSLVGSSRGLGRELDVWELIQKKMLTLSGAHSTTMAAKDPSPGRWTYDQEGRLFLELLETGRLRVSDLITWRARPVECNSVYEALADGGQGHVGILFDWKQDGKPMALKKDRRDA